MKSEGMKFIVMQQYHQLSNAEYNKVFNSWWRFHQILMKFDAKFHQNFQRSNFATFWWCKMLLLVFLCFDFCKLWRAMILFFSNAQVFFNLDSVAVWGGGGLEHRPEILDVHEATLAVLIPDLKRDLKTSSNRWQEELYTNYRQTVTLIHYSCLVDSVHTCP